MASTQRVTPDDQVEIFELLARYCLALDRDDVDAWVSLFTDDASYEVYGRSFHGHDGLRQMMKAAPGGLHLGGLPVIEMIDTDHARTTQNLYFVPANDDPSRRSLYSDELRRTADGWRIALRRCEFITADGIRDRP
jgi:hypothetical protein